MEERDQEPEQYTIDWFIDFYSKIPEEKWTTGFYVRNIGTKEISFCALGHLGIGNSSNKNRKKAARFLSDLFAANHLSVSGINDGLVCVFQQPTPRQRILAALNHFKTLSTAVDK